MMASMNFFTVPNFPLIQPGDDLAAMLLESMAAAGQSLARDDIVVMAQKIVSKAEGRLVRLLDVQPSDAARQLAETTGKDPRVVQVILDDSNAIIRALPGLLIAEQRNGWICANAGVDRSNVASTEEGDDVLALLPLDGDASAAAIRARLADLMGTALEDTPPILINDSHGRAWRIGTMGLCIGCAGLAPIWDQRGLHDLYGYELRGSEECIVDELCAAASLLMGQSAEATPVVIVRGYRRPPHPPAPARTIQRPAAMDAFR